MAIEMKKLFNSIIFLMLAGAAAYAQSSWAGSYSFSENVGKTAGGTAIFITHEMDISEDDGSVTVTLQSNGYQTSRELVGTAKADGGRLNIYFESYGENNTFEPYEQGDLLFSLEKKTVKGKTELLTFWGKFTPIAPENKKTGKVYFKKT
jgi:hypothetical protein